MNRDEQTAHAERMVEWSQDYFVPGYSDNCEYCAAWGDPNDEGGFSWRPCEGCGSTLGGDRYAAHTIDEDHNIDHIDVCPDCYVIGANGID